MSGKLLVTLFLFGGSAVAQGVVELETALQQQYDFLHLHQRRLDSLQALMEMTTQQIESEKTRQRVNQAVVSNLMAQGVSLSQEIRTIQKHIGSSHAARETIRQRLVLQYTVIIDSLQEVEPRVAKPQRAAHRQRIQEWVQRKAWIAPSIKLLSFDPKMVQAVVLGNDTTLRSYVEQVVREIETQLKDIKVTRENVESTITLRQKTLEFADEAREGNPGFLLQPSNIRPTGSFIGETAYDKQFALNASAVAVRSLLSQLSVPVSRYRNSNTANVTLDEYLRWLLTAEKELEFFRTTLNAKLKP